MYIYDLESDKNLFTVKEIFMDRISIMYNIKFRNNVFHGYECIYIYRRMQINSHT